MNSLAYFARCASRNIALGVLAATLMVSSAFADVIKIAHADNEAHPKHLAFVKFGELVKEKSEGRLQVQIFPAGQLGGERELVEALQTGALQVTSVSNGVMSAFSKPFMLLDVPFLFDDAGKARTAIDRARGVLFSDLDNVGLHGLSVWEQGFRQLSSSKAPVREASDVKGMKLRTMEAPLHVAAWRALGANPTPMSWGQVYPSLQTGVIDGQENPLYVVTQEKLFEVQKYVSLTSHIYDAMPVVASNDWWRGLSEADRVAITDAMVEATEYQRGLVGAEVEKARDELARLGVEVVSVPQDVLASMRAIAQEPVLATVKAELGDAVVNRWLGSIAR